MLRGKENSLYNLCDICVSTEQRDFVRQLILDFNEMTADVFNLCLIEMSKHILSYGYSKDECMVAAEIGKHLKTQRYNPEFSNMLIKLIEYYTKYQNNYVKHNDKVNPSELDFIVLQTTAFMRAMM